jgi:drug/metabolite transporter (DMT)-like permease
MSPKPQTASSVPTYPLLILAIIAFAANSVICRLALANNAIDPAGFTIFRILSGVTMLMFIWFFRQQRRKAVAHYATSKGSWFGAAALFAYALGFSYAYVQIDTGTGALILFGSVQLSMITFGLCKGERFSIWQWIGFSFALFGLCYLLWPTLSTPSVFAAIAMLVSGLAWGIYSLIGKGSQDALGDTAFNFARCAVFIPILLIFTYQHLQLSPHGVFLAVLSGAFASGIGYAVWYRVLPHFSSMTAAVSQLSVPVLAAIGGLLFVSETISLRLIIASSLVLGGVLLVLFFRPSRT